MSKEIEEIEEKLSYLDIKLESQEWEEADRDMRNELQIALEDHLIKRDRLAAQKSRSKWLSEGDANSKFFHAMVNRNSKKAEIKSMKINNQWLEGVSPIRDGIHDYFQDFFADKKKSNPNLRGLKCKRIEDWENRCLVEEFTDEEIKLTVWNCDDNRSPGPDGNKDERL
ncbi:hypothetical protein ACS0TY_017619 [Phlomoides rotata]